jgi:thiol-disulfide isomerase/thioredoxin
MCRSPSKFGEVTQKCGNSRYRLEALIFSADWCEPCQEYLPTAHQIVRRTERFDKVHNVEVEFDRRLCDYYCIQGIPCIVYRIVNTEDRCKTFEVPNTRLIGVSKPHVIDEFTQRAIAYYDRIYRCS